MSRRSAQEIKVSARGPQSPWRITFSGLLLCFFLSGAAGLIYQVVWTKALGLVFGHTTYALSTVLAVFMGGLAAGSAWIGRWSESRTQPLASYGWLELGVAASGALSLAGIAGVRVVYLAAYSHGSGTALVALRFLGTAIVLFVPTFLMGGTLPILVRGLRAGSAELGKRFARLYSVNTVGAVIGTLAAGFLFLPTVGMRATLGIAVMLNVFAGVIAFRLARPERTGTPVPTGLERPRKEKPLKGPPSIARKSVPAAVPEQSAPPTCGMPQTVLLICFAVVGATAMAYEIGWTRLLATQLGSSTYAFTLMLATFLSGIAMGSALFELGSRRWSTTQMTFAWTQTLTAATTLPLLVFFTRLPDVMPPILAANGQSFRGVVLAQFAMSAIAMFPAAVVFGFNFPVVTLLIAGRGRTSAADKGEPKYPVARDGALVGRAYAWNTLGAIVGALAAGFWLLPRLGSFHLLAATAAVNVALATALSISAIFSVAYRPVPRRIAAVAGLAANFALLLVIGAVAFTHYFYDPSVATFNTLLYWNATTNPLPLSVREKAHMVDVRYWADGLNSTISVGQTDDVLTLRTNGKVDASNSDTTTQLLLGHVGAIAHPALRRVLVIGFGGGMTLSALARYPEIEHLDCVEIEPAVLGAAPLLTSLNRNVLQDPRVHIIFDDARNFLFTNQNRYDLIVSEPSNPWVAGVASLFTREFYRAAQDRLSPGGIFVQWVHSYSLYPDDLRMVLATFLSQFHGATLWHGVESDLLLMAPTPSSPEILSRMRALWTNTRLRDDFNWMGIEQPEGLFGFYMLDDVGLRNFAFGGRINTDDLTLLEYRAPRTLLVPGLDVENLRELFQAQKDVLPPGFTGDLRDGLLAASAGTALNVMDTDAADRFVRALDDRPATLEASMVRGRDAIAHGDYNAAGRAFDEALAANPKSLEAAWGRAEVNRLSGKHEVAREQLQRVLEQDRGYSRALNSLEQLDSDTSRWLEAADMERRMIEADPRVGADDYAELGEMFKRAGKLDEAVAAMQACLARDPYNFQTHLNLGQIFDYQKKFADARKHLEFVQRFFPNADPQTYALLYEVDNALGDPKAAAESVRFGIRLFPEDPDLLRLNLRL